MQSRCPATARSSLNPASSLRTAGPCPGAVDLRELFNRHAARRRETQRGLGRLAVGTEGIRHRRTLTFDLLIRLLIGDTRHEHSQSARRWHTTSHRHV